jgi:hypothetical protein
MNGFPVESFDIDGANARVAMGIHFELLVGVE